MQAVVIQMLMEFRGDLHLLCEQPSGSWAFKTEWMMSMSAALNMSLDGLFPSCLPTSNAVQGFEFFRLINFLVVYVCLS